MTERPLQSVTAQPGADPRPPASELATYRLGILATHPIQYYAPWFRYLAQRLDIEVFYAHRQDARGQAEAGFGVPFDWDIPLLEGYPHRWLTNVSRRPTGQSFGRFDTPEVYEILKRERFDAFLVFGWNHKSALQTILACWRRNIPVLMRGDSQLAARRSRTIATLKYLPYRWILPRMAAHLYVGQRNKAYLRHYGVPEEKLFFVPHCVDNAYFERSARQAESTGTVARLRFGLGIPNDAFVFLFVGKMIPKKHPEDFLRACLNVLGLPDGANVHAILVGDGPLRGSLDLLARPYATRIHFAGFSNQSAIPAFYRVANALVLPSDGRETWGLVVNEAFACGIPAVVSDACGCAPDMSDEGRTGFTYPVGDVDALAARMLALKALCEREPLMIHRALAEKAVRYSMETATEGLVAALDKVSGKPGRR